MRRRPLSSRSGIVALVSLLAVGTFSVRADEPAKSADTTAEADGTPVFSRDVLTVFRARCQGCHQPAKAGGDYVMTSAAGLMATGESGEPAIVPGDASASYLFAQIATDGDGHAEMPKGQPALAAAEIETIRRWIDAGATIDGGFSAGPEFTAAHPPTYDRPALITTLDISPDGTKLAVGGFHEVLLYTLPTGAWASPDAAKAALAGGLTLDRRLVGLSERIESVRFSPDGTKLAVAGGQPCVFGELQVWDVATGGLDLSVKTTFDTITGACWSPDGSAISFGGFDKSVRAVDAKTGQQVLFNGTHDDFVLDTAFSQDGKYVVSAGRDMTVKLTELATQRFIDNITSITPGALRGGVNAVCAHPTRDEIVIGGADGSPQVFRIHRQTARKIGDNANLIRGLPAIAGRINDVAVSGDAGFIVSGASLDGRGEIAIDAWDFTGDVPKDIEAIMAKRVNDRSAEESAKLEKFHTENVKRVARTTLDDVAVHSVAIDPEGRFVVAAGTGGRLTFIETPTGAVLGTVPAFPASTPSTDKTADADADSDAEGTVPVSTPAADVKADAAESGKSVADGAKPAPTPDFIKDVNPVLSRMGCNAGTCHGAAKGKNGFKLSLRGYDAIFDVRALSDDLKGRRINMADPDRSLMLRKISGGVPHVGGVLTRPGEPYYELIRAWIAGGAPLDTATPRVTGIVVTPTDPTLETVGDRVPFAVTATYADGSTRDVTKEAFVETGNGEVAVVEIDPNTKQPVGRALRRGEAPFLARYEGAYAATTVTVMGDRGGFTWQDVPAWTKIDELAIAKWKRMKIRPSELATDDEFLRRVHLDLTGLPPTAETLAAFLADGRDTRLKRQEVIDRLIGSPEFVEYWSNKWADLLQINAKFLGSEGADSLRQWVRQEVRQNTPLDELARKIITASGSNRENPAASYYKITRDPAATLENTTHLFLGVRFNCNKCHDHPFERWTQDQYYQTAAFFAGVKLEKDPESKDKTIGGTAVEGAKPLYEIVKDDPKATVTHERTQAVAEAIFPYETEFTAAEGATDRERFAAWLTSADNRYFAKSWANRMWGYLLGTGLIEPIDDIRAGNPPTNPELLDYLTEELVAGGFDMQELIRTIVSSRVYQLSIATNEFNADDAVNYSHALPRRLPAEVIFDAVHAVTGTPSEIPGEKPGTRAASLADAAAKLPSGFLATLGRPVRESVCECERSTELQLGPVMALISGDVVARAIESDKGEIANLVATTPKDDALVDALAMRVLSRHATAGEVDAYRQTLTQIDADHALLVAALDDRQKYVAANKPTWEKERLARIAKVEADLAARRAAIKDEQSRLSKQRDERIAKAEAAAKAVREKVAAGADAWLAQQGTAAVWTTLRPRSATAGKESKLTFQTQPDGAVLVVGEQDKVDYALTYDVGLTSVTQLRLEAISDERLPNKGPGMSPGNFVLNELVVEVAPLPAGTDFKPVKLVDAEADFAQANFPVAKAIDGQPNPREGWAISPRTGQTHWATFRLETPVTSDAGVRLRVRMQQRYGGRHHLGKFRLAATGVAKSVGLSLSEELLTVASVPAKERSEAMAATLLAAVSNTSDELTKAEAALADAKAPVPRDAEEVALEGLLAEVKKPLAEDATLAQLTADVAASEAQRDRKRLTAAQDLVWAMMNSPGFLFNH